MTFDPRVQWDYAVRGYLKYTVSETLHTATTMCNKRQAIPIKKKTGPDRHTDKGRRRVTIFKHL